MTNLKSGSESNDKFVMKALSFDSTGPVMLTLCGQICSTFPGIMRVNPVNSIISLQDLRVVALQRNAWNGMILMPVRDLQPMDVVGTQMGTQFQKANEAT